MDIKSRLMSRKFWLAAVGAIAGLSLAVYGSITNQADITNQGVTLITISIGAYIGVEGAADVVTRSKQGETDKLVTLAKLDGELDKGSDSDIDSDRDIVSGR